MSEPFPGIERCACGYSVMACKTPEAHASRMRRKLWKTLGGDVDG